MLNGFKPKLAGIIAAGVVALSATPVMAATGITIQSNPTHLLAPATEVFIVRVPAGLDQVPARAEVRYVGKTSHYKMTLTKAAKHAWGGSVYASIPGTLTVSVYSRAGQLMKTQEFPVAKAKESWVPRIIIGALFIGIALWYWRRMQSVTNPNNPRRR
jgi:hypothetical protein